MKIQKKLSGSSKRPVVIAKSKNGHIMVANILYLVHNFKKWVETLDHKTQRTHHNFIVD